ncbi:MAG: cyclic-di-AMP receptor [Anaerolineae bacterium]|nr:cyclic-di-AMP receptor [Anaerolineae bacterium]
MKLIITVMDDKDVHHVMTALTDQHFGVTCVSSTGGLIAPGNSTLLIGVEAEHVPQVMQVITDLAALRQTFVPYTYAADMSLAGLVEVQVGGFLSFVLDVVHFEQV